LDEGNNSIIFYFIISGNDNGSFQLDKRDGSIYNQINMDRETQAMYEIFIKASSDENYAENEVGELVFFFPKIFDRGISNC
jgi:Cadherin domain.